MKDTIGTCSLCGGAVVYPMYGGRVPYCESCGATKKQPHGPVVEMEPPRGCVFPPYKTLPKQKDGDHEN